MYPKKLEDIYKLEADRYNKLWNQDKSRFSNLIKEEDFWSFFAPSNISINNVDLSNQEDIFEYFFFYIRY